MAQDKTPVDANAKEKTQRRVYVLPNDLVDRIVAYQSELGLSSEVEAARRLLDEALKRRDDFQTVTGRLVSQLKTVRSLREAAKDVLIDHPLVKGVSFENDLLTFNMFDGISVEITKHGVAIVTDEYRNTFNFGDDVPDWASKKAHPRPAGGRMNDIIDDDIPF